MTFGTPCTPLPTVRSRLQTASEAIARSVAFVHKLVDGSYSLVLNSVRLLRGTYDVRSDSVRCRGHDARPPNGTSCRHSYGEQATYVWRRSDSPSSVVGSVPAFNDQGQSDIVDRDTPPSLGFANSDGYSRRIQIGL